MTCFMFFSEGKKKQQIRRSHSSKEGKSGGSLANLNTMWYPLQNVFVWMLGEGLNSVTCEQCFQQKIVWKKKFNNPLIVNNRRKNTRW